MASTTGRFHGNLLRLGIAVALSVFATLVSIAPANAQVRVDNGNHYGWYKNGTAAQKEAKRAARLGGQQQQQRGVVVDNGTVIDRSRVARTGTQRGTTYRNGNYYDQYGNRVYDYRNRRVDPYSSYPQYRRQQYGYNNYPYGNSGYNNYGYSNNPYGYSNAPYYDNREGDLNRNEVAQRASQNGYYAGYQRGAYDAQQRNRPNPQGHGAYQYGFDGFDPSWGSASTYQQYYRQSFIHGYQDGYGQRGYTRESPRRRF